MEENKKNELKEEALDLGALTNSDEPQKCEIGIDDVEVAEIEALEVENVEAQDTPPVEVTEKPRWHREKRARPPKEKSHRAKKEPKPPKEPAKPIAEPILPLILCTVAFAISLFALLINKLLFPFSKELLAPVILQVVALIIPAYLCMMVTSGNKSLGAQFKEIGFKKLQADHVFFMIFAALFTVCASLALTLAFGGASDASRGITLLGTFRAGVNEYTVSYPYLILTYVLIPAVAEEIFFRGVIFSRLEKVSFPLAAVISCVTSALYGFSLGGLIPALFVSAMLVFTLYTTGSVAACMIVHLLVNLYRLLLEANISAYFLASQNNILLLITVFGALLISAALFFSESLRIFRRRAESIANGEAKSARKLENLKGVGASLRSTLAYKPSLILTIVCCAIFVSAVVINYLV